MTLDRDLLERAAATFLQTLAAVLIIDGADWDAALAAAVAAGLAVVKATYKQKRSR